MSTQAAVYDLTLFDKDGNILFGTTSSGVVTESSFQTSDPGKSHDRPWLQVPDSSTPTRIDFPKGSSRIGARTVSVLDVRKTSTDQTSGTLTEKIHDAKGGRALFRRWDATNSQWIVLMDGVTYSFEVDQGEVVTYNLRLRDGREFERGGELFSSNFVLWGEDGKEGPLINYGEIPGGLILTNVATKYLIPKVGPYLSEDIPGLRHFEVKSDSDPDSGIHWGMVAVDDLELPDLGWPTQDEDGVFKYRDIRVRWRAKGSSDDWTVLRNMPRIRYENVIKDDHLIIRGDTTDSFASQNAIYLASTTKSEIPTHQQEIEFQVLAEEISEDTPFFWDGGTAGDLLNEISNGDHSDSVPDEPYDASEISNFQSEAFSVRFILKEPVKDRRKWVEENIYQPALRAPAFNSNQEIFAASWLLPDNTESIDILDEDTILSIGQYEDGTSNAIRKVEFTYIREILQSEEEAKERLNIQDDTGTRTVPRWKRLIEKEATLPQEDSNAVPGAKVLTYSPITVRSLARVNDHTFGGGDNQDELGNRLFRRAAESVLPRFKSGAARWTAEVAATDTNLGYQIGDWLRVRAEWLPEESTGKRQGSSGPRRYMQIAAISDVNPAVRKFVLVDGGAKDATGDPDLVDADGTDCFTGGTATLAPNGATLRFFEADGTLKNTCGEAIEVTALMVAGGGAGYQPGNDRHAGGGGGAGGVLTATFTVNPGESIPVRVGAGAADPSTGSGGTGEDSVIWVDGNGDALDPSTDPVPAATQAHGGGSGSGGNSGGGVGGSGGGGGALSGVGGGQTGGKAIDAQGNDGGDGQGRGGAGTFNRGAGGGGGSFAAAGQNGDATVSPPSGGGGGAGQRLSDWGVDVGGGGGGGAYEEDAQGDIQHQSSGEGADEGYGAGGVGGAGGGVSNPEDPTDATGGSAGFIAFRYAGAEQTLSAPSVTSTSETDENQVEVCIEDADWPTVTPDGYRVRVEYAYTASGASEPAADSGDWQVAGYLEEPGCVKTDPVPTGAKVWHRVFAEADDFQPSDPGTTGSDTTTQTAKLITLDLTLDGVTPTLAWTPNDFVSSLRIRGEVHDADATLSDPLPLIDEVPSDDLSLVLSNQAVDPERFLTVDVVCFDDIDWGYDRAVLADSPETYLRLGEGSGTTANDASTNNNDGTYVGSPTLGATGLLTEDANTAVTLDGTDDAVTIAGVGSVGALAARTLELWIQTTESGQERIFGVRNSGDDTQWQIVANMDVSTSAASGTTLIRAVEPGGDRYHEEITTNIYDGETHHIVVAQDGHTDWRIYVDGTLVTPNDTASVGTYDSPTAWDVDPAIGALNKSGTLQNFAAATVDEFALYSSALSETRIQDHYNIGIAEDQSELQVAGTEGRTHRASVENVADTVATPSDVDEALDNLAFDSELGLALDYELNPIRDSS